MYLNQTSEQHIYHCDRCANEIKLAQRLAQLDNEQCRFILNLCACGGQLRYIGTTYSSQIRAIQTINDCVTSSVDDD